MKKIALTSLLAMFAVSAASAATSPYVAAHVGYVAPTFEIYGNHDHYGMFSNDNFAYDLSIAAGVKHDLGSTFALRGEVEYDYISGIKYNIDGEGDTWARSQTLLFNGYIDMKTATALTPYVGAGIGYQWTNMEEHDLGNPHAFAWQVGAGVSYALCDHLSVDLGYRYLSSTDKASLTGEHGDAFSAKMHNAYHQFRLGAAYAF